MISRRLRLRSPEEALELLGEQDAALRRMEADYGVEMFLRQDAGSAELILTVKGSSARVEKALRRLHESVASIRRGPQRLERASAKNPGDSGGLPLPAGALYRTQSGKIIRARTPHQERYIQSVLSHDLVFGIGPAGTGKTFLAVACALRELDMRRVARIVITRPVVEAGEKLGFLPGDLLEKINPYLKPIYDAFYVFLGPERFRMLRDDEVVEIVPLAYMRGRTFDDAFIILDEAQNTTPEQMKMFLTRMGTGSRMVVTGDVTQSDLGEHTISGLVRVIDILKKVEGVDFQRLTEEDVVRHPMVKKIIRAYEQWAKFKKL